LEEFDLDLSNYKDFLDAYERWKLAMDKVGEKTSCDSRLHDFWLCCPEHRIIQARLGLLKQWAKYFEVQYNMYDQYGQYFTDSWLKEFRTRVEKRKAK
jgi:hypothetical protein